jgi:UDP-glucuronate 4-epimerase
VSDAVLLTGCAGFIGSHLAERLLRRGQPVVGLDNFDPFYDRAIKERNVAEVRRRGGSAFTFHEGDIRDGDLVERLVREHRATAVIHLAARAGVRPSVLQPELYADVNVRGTASVFEAARRAGVSRIVFASSSSVYGAGAAVPFREDAAGTPVSPYAATKRANELQAAVHHHLYGGDICGLRFFTAYGPRQRPEMAIHLFTRLIDEGRPVVVYGDGSARRDFTFIDDIVAGVVCALDASRGCQVYNLGESHTTSVDDVIGVIASALGKPARVEYRDAQPGDVPLTFADVSRARAELGYDPRTPLAEGVARFVAWYRESGAPGGSE